MYSKAVLALENVELLRDERGVARNDAYTCIGVFNMLSAVERIIRVDKKMNYADAFGRSMQNTLYKFATQVGYGGYHGFYECFNWEAACATLFDTFQVDSLFAIQLYARWRRVKLVVDGEQVGGTQDDGLHYEDAEIIITSLGSDHWIVELGPEDD